MKKWSVHFLSGVVAVLFYGCEFSDYRELLVSGGIFVIVTLGLGVFIGMMVKSMKHKQWESQGITTKSMSDSEPHYCDSNIYEIGFYSTFLIVFIACWIYAIASWGFLIGVGLGWIPSVFIALIAGFIWPLIALVLVVGLCIIGFIIYKSN